jgi:hypothetical protein
MCSDAKEWSHRSPTLKWDEPTRNFSRRGDEPHLKCLIPPNLTRLETAGLENRKDFWKELACNVCQTPNDSSLK